MTKTHTINTMQPAFGVIQALGGSRQLSRDIAAISKGAHKITHSGICHWAMPASSKGTNGNIPVKHWAVLLKVAESKGIAQSIKQMLEVHLPDVDSLDAS